MTKTAGILFLLISFIISFSGFGQGLIPNPGFESGWSCPEDYTKDPVKELIPYWKNPNKGTPDYFHRCSEKAGIPNNFAGQAEAAEGDAYVGIILREVYKDSLDSKKAAREYLEVELNEQLEFRQLYCFNLKYRLSSGSRYATDGLGVSFTRDRMKAWNFGILDAEPMVFNFPGHMMENKNEWIEMCGVFRARGREKFLTIGNFIPSTQPHYIVNQDSLVDSAFVYAYYYIDDIKLYKIENEFECGCMDDNSMGYDWLDDDPKSYFDYYYEHIEDLYQQELLAMNNSNNSNSNQNNSNENNNDSDSKTQGDKSDNQSTSNGNSDELNSKNQSDNNTSSTNSNDGNVHDENSESSGDINVTSAFNNNLGFDSIPDPNQSDRLAELQAKRILNSNTNDNKSREDILNKMRNATEGFALNLPKVYFAFNQSELLPSSYPTMEYLAQVLEEEPDLMIEIRGHTDNIGSSRYNKKLSQERAKSVYEFLTEAGIDKSRLSYEGYGNENPIADNSTEFGRQLNRRVEIIVLSK